MTKHWHIIPMAFTSNMPQWWRSSFDALLAQLSRTFKQPSGISQRVQHVRNGKITKAPEWVKDASGLRAESAEISEWQLGGRLALQARLRADNTQRGNECHR